MRDLERKTWQPSAILNVSKASVSTSVVMIHTRSEDSSDSDSAFAASVASMNQALALLCISVMSSSVISSSANFNDQPFPSTYVKFSILAL